MKNQKSFQQNRSESLEQSIYQKIIRNLSGCESITTKEQGSTGKQSRSNYPKKNPEKRKVIILGGGIAGLSAGYFLNKHDIDFTIYEGSQRVGGLANSFTWNGVDCDFAPHRLYTEDKAILEELLGLVDCERIERKSKIVLNGKIINDPVNAIELFLKFLPFKSIGLASSYLLAKLKHKTPPRNFVEFVEARYGTGLSQLFFKPYAEKLFGIPADQISEKWGERKVRVSGLKDMIKKSSKLYFDHFYYPKQGGYGSFVKVMEKACMSNIHRDRKLTNLLYDVSAQGYYCTFADQDGKSYTEYADVIISTIPITTLASALGIEMNLSYRPAKLVYMHIDKPKVMDNHWMYFVDGDKKINRIAEFKNFSKKPANSKTTVLCAEITNTLRFSVDAIIQEIIDTGMITAESVIDTKTICLPHAYPVYNLDYETEIDNAVNQLGRYKELHYLGRQAQFEHQDIDEIFAMAKQVSQEIIKQSANRKPFG